MNSPRFMKGLYVLLTLLGLLAISVALLPKVPGYHLRAQDTLVLAIRIAMTTSIILVMEKQRIKPGSRS